MLRRRQSKRARSSFQKKAWKLSALEKRLMLAGDVGAAMSPIDAFYSAAFVSDDWTTQEQLQSQSPHLVIISADVILDGRLLESVPANAEIAVLDPQQDGVEQITAILASRRNLQSIHLLSHGSEAQLQLGSTTLSSDNLDHYAPLISQWGQSVSQGGDLLLYGCNVAEGQIGQQFVRQIAVMTGVDVAASIDRTAAAIESNSDGDPVDSRGDGDPFESRGDWDLEWSQGEINHAGLLDADVLNGYQGSLAISWGRPSSGSSSSGGSSSGSTPDPEPPPPDPPSEPLPSNRISLQDLGVSASTGEKPQSKIWTYADQWWTVMPNDTGTWISRLDGTSWTPALQLSSSTSVSADVKVSDDLAHILLLDGTSSQLASVEYASTTNSYNFWAAGPGVADLGLPSGIETATIDIDSQGRMWIAYDQSSSIEVRYSDGSYTNWSAPITVASNIGSDDISVITALPNNTIGVMWSDQRSDRFGFRYHIDGDDPTAWSTNEVPGSQSALNIGNGMADDHLNVAVGSDGTLYAAVKTSYDSSSQTKIGLLVRRPNGTWDNLYHVDGSGTRPIVILNESAGRILVAYTESESGGDILYRESGIEQISFGAQGTLLSGSLNNPTSTKQNFTDEVVILASGGSRASGVLFSFDDFVVNQAPQVTAGSDLTITLDQTAILAGLASDDGLPDPPGSLTTNWSVVSGPGSVNFGNAAAMNTTAQFSTEGVYVLQLTASDSQRSSSDQVTITVNPAEPIEAPLVNLAPQVSAGSDRTITLGSTATLSGFVSDDGLPSSPGSLTTAWSVVSGPGTVSFGDATAVSTTAQFSAAGTYILRLTASDGELASSDQATIQVTDSSSPVTMVFQDGVFPYGSYEGTRDTKIYANNSTSNYGTASTLEVDGSPDIASLIRWDLSAIPVGSTVTSVTIELSITNSTSDNYEVYALQRAWDEMTATWNQAAAGTPWSTGGASGGGDRGSTVLGQLASSSTGTYQVTLNAAGLATVQSWIDSPSTNHGIIFQDYLDAKNGADFASREATDASQRPKLSITYQPPATTSTPTNQAPIVSAGSDQTVALGSNAILAGLVSDDGLPNPPGSLTTQWSVVSGPGNVTLGNVNAVNTTAQFSAAGTYVLQLSAGDGQFSTSDQVTITVVPTVSNQAPQVLASSDQTLTLGQTAVLAGLVSDDGLPDPPGTLTTQWTVVSGPGSVNFGNANSLNTTAQFNTVGTYVLQLSVSDGQLSNSDQVIVVVNPVVTNQAPIVWAGNDQTITFGGTALLSGIVNDDGLPSTPGAVITSWSTVSGPGSVSFGNSSATSTTAQFSTAGTYVLRLTASDGQISSSDQVTITVNAANQSGLVGHWTFDNITNGTVADTSGLANDGSIQGNPQVVSGPSGSALDFNGSSDFVQVADSSSLDVTDQITLAAWIRPERNGTQYVIKKATYGETDGFELSLSSSGSIFVRFNQASERNAHRLDSSINYPTDGSTWLHVVATYDGNTIKLYINGQLDSSKADQFEIATNDLALAFGAESDGYRAYSGSLDDVAIYDRALSAEEVQALYFSGFTA